MTNTHRNLQLFSISLWSVGWTWESQIHWWILLSGYHFRIKSVTQSSLVFAKSLLPCLRVQLALHYIGWLPFWRCVLEGFFAPFWSLHSSINQQPPHQSPLRAGYFLHLTPQLLIKMTKNIYKLNLWKKYC